MKYSKSLLYTLFILSTSILMSACSSPVTYDVSFKDVTFDAKNRKTVASAINLTDRTKIENLTLAIINLGKNIDKQEASFVAREAVLYPQHLANEYRLIGPPNSQNILVNTGKRKKGHCYHFAQDMTDQIVRDRTYETLSLQRAVANQGGQFEHNVLTVAAKGKGIKDAIILDAWRNSATLLWMKTTEDPDYTWTKYYPRRYIIDSNNKKKIVTNPEKPANRI